MKEQAIIFITFLLMTSCLQNAKNNSEFREDHLPHWDVISPSIPEQKAVKIKFLQLPSLSSSADNILDVTPIISIVDDKDEVVVKYDHAVILKSFSDEGCSIEVENSSLGNDALAVAGGASFPRFQIISTQVRSLQIFSDDIFSDCLGGINITPGEVYSLKFSEIPAPLSITAGEVFTNYPVITSYDQFENIRSTDSVSTIELMAFDEANCSGASIAHALGGESSKTLNSGMASFEDLTLNKIALKSLQASIGSVSVCLSSFNVSASVPSPSTSSLNVTNNVAADGEAEAVITLTILDQFDNPISGHTPTISVSGTNNSISTCSATDTEGISTCGLTSTRAESKTLTVTNSNLSGLTGVTQFVAGEPSNSNSTISLATGLANNTSPLTVTITIRDANSNPIQGVVPDYEILNGTGTYTKLSACTSTNSLGVSTCTFRTFRGNWRALKVTSPEELTSVYGRGNLNCSISSYFDPGQGDGMAGNPYQITNIEQLDQLRCVTSRDFILMNDLDLADIDWMTADYKTSIGFDGNNKVISNMRVDINIPEYQKANVSASLASFLGQSSGWHAAYKEIKNLTFQNPIVISRGTASTAAVVAGYSVYKFENIHVHNGLVEASDMAAGLVHSIGSVPNGDTLSVTPAELLNSSFEGVVRMVLTDEPGPKYRFSVAGLVGTMMNAGANIKGNSFTGRLEANVTVNSGFIVSGLIGASNVNTFANSDSGELGVIENNLIENVNVETSGVFVGSIIGQITKSFSAPNLNIRSNTSKDISIVSSATNNAFIGGAIGSIQFGGNNANRNFAGKEIIIERNSIENMRVRALASSSAKIGGLVGKGLSLIAQDNSIKNLHVESIFNSGSRCIGGLMGMHAEADSSIGMSTQFQRNYIAMSLSSWNNANTCVKGLVGNKVYQGFSVNLSSNSNYFDAELSGLTEIAPYLDNGFTTHEMQNTLFSGWDADNIWNFTPGFYPSLR